MYERKKRTQKQTKILKIHTEIIFLFCHTGVKFFVIVWIYIYVKVEGSALQERKVQKYITIGEEFLK